MLHLKTKKLPYLILYHKKIDLIFENELNLNLIYTNILLNHPLENLQQKFLWSRKRCQASVFAEILSFNLSGRYIAGQAVHFQSSNRYPAITDVYRIPTHKSVLYFKDVLTLFIKLLGHTVPDIRLRENPLPVGPTLMYPVRPSSSESVRSNHIFSRLR